MWFVYLLSGFNLIISLVLLFLFFKLKNKSSLPPSTNSRTGTRIGLVKFNPFPDTGGEQSFVLSLLDGGDNGILITSLHNRGTTRLYAKRVTAGKPETDKLSQEEKEALLQVLHQ